MVKPVVTAAQAKLQDEIYPGDLGAVMERAGYAVAVAAGRMGADYGARVAVLAGVGNNGGDAYVAARHLARRGCQVVVHSMGPPRTEESASALATWLASGGRVRPLDEHSRADVVVDGLFGVGFHGELPAAAQRWAASDATVVAIDVPSGLDGSTGEAAAGTFVAECTIGLSAFKVGHFVGNGPDHVGALHLVDLGMPAPEPTLRLCELIDAPRPERPRDAHKWSAGSVAVVGGSAGLVGAAVLAARAALAFGAGAVAAFVPGGLATLLDAAQPEIMTHGIGDGTSLSAADPSELLAAVKRFDALVVGPGMGVGCEAITSAIVDAAPQTLVLDADGLNSTAGAALAGRRFPLIATPHGGEFTRLGGEAPSHQAAQRLASKSGSVVLLKGPASVIADPTGPPWLVTTGGPELATVGTGDVLAGMIAALAARGLSPAVAARSAAFWHGRIGAGLATAGAVTAGALVDEARRFAF